ncbi:MAG: AAA-like domain-containing protein [Eubacteriales bacterium]|nr:AAA-like domain-containing protein [Eubacteriales bacterium]
MKKFNTVGRCIPKIHYMVNIDDKLKKIQNYVNNGYYFVINRARQYGKTTTLKLLAQYLKENYIVISMDFQKMSNAKFENEYAFSSAFANLFFKAIEKKNNPVIGLDETVLDNFYHAAQNGNKYFGLVELFEYLSGLCETSVKPLVLIIDEVDSATNNQVFLDFLAQLRGYYLDREETAAFQSVILAGVYDIKNLRHKIRPEDEHRYNSPWNIAADFTVDMSFSPTDIITMLQEYEQEHSTGMDMEEMAHALYNFTGGYPYLVSALCQKLDDMKLSWTLEGLQKAVQAILCTTNTLFDDLIKNLENHREFRRLIESILIGGEDIPFVLANPEIDRGVMYGILKSVNGKVGISNYIFEAYIYEYLISVNKTNNLILARYTDKTQYIHNGQLDMKMVLQKFAAFLKAEYRDEDGEFIVELKLWHGTKKEKEAYEQLSGYLDARGVETGYLLSFCTNKKPIYKEQIIKYNGHEIYEVVVTYAINKISSNGVIP